jgi:hypothetical protein
MPVIFVWNAYGLSTDNLPMSHQNLVEQRGRRDRLAEALQAAVLSVHELGQMQKGDILVVYPDGAATPSDLTLISVDVLFDKRERTREVREKLAEKLKKAALDCYAKRDKDHGYRVEVAIRRFDPKTDVYL